MTARWLGVAAAACVAASLGACSGEDPLEVGTGPLAGTIGGQPWTYAQGATDPLLVATTEPYAYARLYGEAFPACGFPAGLRHLILPNLPRYPGDFPFALGGTTGTIHVPPSDDFIVTQGRLIVEEVSGNTVTARVRMIWDAQNEVDGRFVTTVCDGG